MSLNEWRVPRTRTRGAAATSSRSASSVAGRWSRSAPYAWLPAQLTPVPGMIVPTMMPKPPAHA